MIASRVTSAVVGASMKLSLAAGARLKPISATIVPVTSGGISAESHPVPSTWTITPIRNSAAPAMTTPPRAPPGPYWPMAAEIGAMNANDEPR